MITPSSQQRDNFYSAGVNSNDSKVAIVILAAGASSRMGRSKQLLEIEGEPLLRRCAKVALEVNQGPVIVVLGANEKLHREIVEDLPLYIISNHFWKTGMGSSIKTGLNYLIQVAPEAKGAILSVCDQPALSRQHLEKLIQKFKTGKKKIIASSYAHSSGVPVLFGRPFFSNLLLLGDEQGAKKIVQQFPTEVDNVEFPKGSIDLDTEEDYQSFLTGQS
jgi:molybdenum cofactor cytidylyltransferase